MAVLNNELNKELSGLFNMAPVMVHAIDSNGAICYANPFFLKKLKYEYDDVIGQTSFSFLTPESREYAAKYAIPLLKEQGFVENIPYQFITKDDELIDISLNAYTTMGDDEGNFLYGIAISSDVTEKKKYQRLLEKNEKKLLELNDELRVVLTSHLEMADEMDQLIYSFSHDLKSPLCTMEGLISLLNEDNVSKELRAKIVNKTRAAIESMYKRIDSIQKIHRNKLHRGDTTLSSSVLDKIIHEELYKYELQIASNDIKIETDITTTKVLIDGFRIRSIVNILINNAIQFHDISKKQRYIKIACNVENNILNLSCIDNGIGIPWEINKKIFEMFFRGDSRSSGAGLGLYLLKKVVEKLHGSYQVESKLGEGFKLFISLPLEKDAISQ